MNKSLAIIGSSGMIGFDLMQYLKSDFKIIEINRENYKKYMGKNFDIVINANGNSRKLWANDNKISDFNASTASVYHSLVDFPCKVYIYISSADIYPDHTNKPNELKAIIPDNLTPYGLHKYLSECIVRNFTKNYIILRCPLMLGTKLKKGPIYDILGSQLFISEKSAFQMITTKELAKIIHFLLKKKIMGEVFNIGGKGRVILSDITDSTYKGETQIYEMDVSKLHEIYPLKTSNEYLQGFAPLVSYD